MRILLLTHAFNSLTQRLFVELQKRDYEVSVEFDINDAVTQQAIDLYQPDLIIAPFLKRVIPKNIWSNYLCLIVHPGIKGDRGASALDWAILNNEQIWGVTVLQANEEMDAGDIWASYEFPMREATKSSLYRHEVIEAALKGVLQSIEHLEAGDFQPVPLDPDSPDIQGKLRPLMQQSERRINWLQDTTATVLRKIRSADGFPGVKDQWLGREVFLFDAHPETDLTGKAGELIARCGNAVCRATIDGAVWIGHLCDKQGDHPFKLPATYVLADYIKDLPEITSKDYQEISYEEQAGVGYLYFDFYNGAMSSQQCQQLQQALKEAKQQDTRVIVLMGGSEYWSNGIHLNRIEAAESPADESWENINAMNDLAEEIINTSSQLIISALQGNAGAGGVFLARAADEVWARNTVILNPHYKDMGNLYGSEYWTYLLPRYTSKANARRITQARLPIGTDEAMMLGLVNKTITGDVSSFISAVKKQVEALAHSEKYETLLTQKQQQRMADEAEKPLQQYRDEELAKMHLNFYGFDPSYHVARYNFVYKIPKSRTPVTIAMHRRK
jgi:putative two-component system hydrogenase maturation factor HypX/HoxX